MRDTTRWTIDYDTRALTYDEIQHLVGRGRRARSEAARGAFRRLLGFARDRGAERSGDVRDNAHGGAQLRPV